MTNTSIKHGLLALKTGLEVKFSDRLRRIETWNLETSLQILQGNAISLSRKDPLIFNNKQLYCRVNAETITDVWKWSTLISISHNKIGWKMLEKQWRLRTFSGAETRPWGQFYRQTSCNTAESITCTELAHVKVKLFLKSWNEEETNIILRARKRLLFQCLVLS